MLNQAFLHDSHILFWGFFTFLVALVHGAPPPRIFQTFLRPCTQCHDWPSIKVDLVSNWLGLDVISKVITLSFSRSVPATRTIVLSVCLCHRSLLRREIESRESRYGYTVITCEQTFDHPHTNTQWVHINSEEEHFAEFSFKFQYVCTILVWFFLIKTLSRNE